LPFQCFGALLSPRSRFLQMIVVREAPRQWPRSCARRSPKKQHQHNSSSGGGHQSRARPRAGPPSAEPRCVRWTPQGGAAPASRVATRTPQVAAGGRFCGTRRRHSSIAAIRRGDCESITAHASPPYPRSRLQEWPLRVLSNYPWLLGDNLEMCHPPRRGPRSKRH